MKVGIYSRAAHPIADALGKGFKSLGHACAFREQSLWQKEVEKFDLVMVNGMRGGAKIAAAYKLAGTQVLVYDFGYLKRVNSRDEYTKGHWQVGVGGLNKLPPFECPSDRFDALGLEIVEKGGDPNGYVLICGQVPGDAALGQNSSEHRQWLREQMSLHDDAVYRPHPRGGIAIPGIVGNNKPLDEALAGARLVVTYTSNVGHDALLAGVPVLAHGPAAYAELSGEELPSVKARRAYFNRVAYGQWTVDEMASGEAQKVWLEGLDAQDDKSDAESTDEGNDAGATDEAQAGEAGDQQLAEAVDYASLKVPELRALLSERGVTIPAGTNKAGLLELLEQ